MRREDSTRINFVISAPMLAALKKTSHREGRPYSWVIREALADYLGVSDTVKLGGAFEKRADEKANSR